MCIRRYNIEKEDKRLNGMEIIFRACPRNKVDVLKRICIPFAFFIPPSSSSIVRKSLVLSGKRKRANLILLPTRDRQKTYPRLSEAPV